MSSIEDIESKTGRAPATKVGGVRQTRHRTTSEDIKNPPNGDVPEEDQEESEDTSVEKSKTKMNLWGADRDPAKDYPSEAVKHMQNKPVPTHAPTTKPASARPNIIQQPR